MKPLKTLQGTSHGAGPWGRLFPLLVLLVALHASASPLVTFESPIGFFTNVASRLLSAQMGLELNHIQVYPTNQYTPAVHRVLQLTANLYDAATNRPVAGDYPFLPTIFRPLFRRDTTGAICIVGYREVADDSVADFNGAGSTNVVLGLNNSAIPLVGTPFSPSDCDEPLVSGIPLVIGARKGLPNFNEFAMDTMLTFGRRLRFVRDAAGNIAATNAMFLLNLTNTFGLEAWNSYLSAYPRPLDVRMEAVLYALLTTNLTSTNNLLCAPGGAGDLADPVATYIYRPAPALIPANTWQGYTDRVGYPPSRNSFRAVTQSFSWTNAQYSRYASTLLPLPGVWDSPNISLPPGLYLTLRPMVRFALVDTSVSPGRLIDYVSLDATAAPTNLMALMQSGAQCSTPAGGGAAITPGSLWCENLYNGVPIGILNQIMVNLGNVDDPLWPTTSHQADVDFFRWQFGLSPLYYPSGTFPRTNTFYTAYGGERPLTYHVRWQANDPLVHYTVPDLVDLLGGRPALEFDFSRYPAMSELGGLSFFTAQAVGASTPLNEHYRPWGGNPIVNGDTFLPTNWRLELKDPLVSRSDAWEFPTNAPADLSWLGRVHRGTPWQTLYLKSSAIDLSTWTAWTGDNMRVTNFGIAGAQIGYDAAFSHPTNDWRLAALLVSLLSTHDPRTLGSVNEPSAPTWTSALDGLLAWTNISPDAQLMAYRLLVPPAFAPVLVQSNTPQAAFLAAAIAGARSRQPGQHFSDAGDILATAELSAASPFLNQGAALNILIRSSRYTYQQTYGLSEAAYEALPAQLLPRLRSDSLATIVPGAGPLQVQFSGADGYRYAVEVSTNLVNWVGVSTNYPSNGRFLFQEPLPATASGRFYRSSLLP